LTDKVELNGRTYLWTGHEWLDETYIRPPQVIIRQLQTQFPHLAAAPTNKPGRRRSRPQDDDTILHEISATITAFIHHCHQETQAYVTRDEIAAALLQAPKSRDLIQQRYQNSENDLEWHAGNLVDWFSSQFTTELSIYVNEFERQKINDKWAYKPRPFP
jgi:hypothetical protein